MNESANSSSRLLSLIDLVVLKRTGPDQFDLSETPASNGRVLGSGLIAASLLAAAATCHPSFTPTGLHVSFLRSGKADSGVALTISKTHAGRTTTHRSVDISQSAGTIAAASVRFMIPADGPSWHAPGLVPLRPDEGHPEHSVVATMPLLQRDFEVRAAETPPHGRRIIHPYWIRHRRRLPDNPLLHAALIGLLTDIGVSGSARQPETRMRDRLEGVTLDHSLWWHRPARVDEWLLITATALTESNGRALARGEVLTSDGTLVASFSQDAFFTWRQAP